MSVTSAKMPNVLMHGHFEITGPWEVTLGNSFGPTGCDLMQHSLV